MKLTFTLRVGLLCSLPFIFQLLTSCCECRDQEFFPYYHCFATAMNLDNSGLEAVQTQTDSLKASAYGIRFFIEHQDEICQLRKPTFSFMNGAYAFSCDCPPDIVYQAENPIIAIRIFSVNDFSQDRPAGSVVTDYFRIFDNNNNYEQVTSESLMLNADDEYEPDGGEWDILLLEKPENLGSSFQFHIEFERIDGTTFSTETPEIILL